MQADDLGEAARTLIEAVVVGELAWSTPEQLGHATNLSEDVVEDALLELDEAGWIVAWEEWPPGICVTLSLIAAAALGVRIVEAGREERPRWARPGESDPWPRATERTFRRAGVLALVVDPRPSPLDQLVEAEERKQLAEASQARPLRGAWEDSRRAAVRAEAARDRRKARRRAKRAHLSAPLAKGVGK